MGEDLGDNRDPLLVRPFVLPDGPQQEPSLSASTWPVEHTAGELPTQLLPVVPVAESDRSGEDRQGARRRRGLLLLIGSGVTSAAFVAGYAMLRPADRSDTWASMPGNSLPVAVGPATSASVSPTGAPTGETGTGTENRTGAGTGTGSADEAGKATTSPPAQKISPPSSVAGDVTGASAAPSGTASGNPATVAPAPPVEFAPAPVRTGRGLLVTGNGLCLDLHGDAIEGGEVHVDDCNGTSPQRWRLNSDRTLEVLDMCAYLAGDGTVELTRCDGRTTAQWQLSEDGTLVNAATAQCLTDPHSGARPGRSVIVTTCDGANNQRWTFR
ncbi:ricin-type beta-trefoil lectin domain protein [Actinoplanes sp. NEAU-A12]|uniref:Ricin-type beta-trefoil lectin domain protein n=1 Tax=Actinoplanes sandaracinus TaxID=3045177 RepID=A0ABT6X0E6_9ACTN|nr:ricin-type beta-trefoil lectin domain protein [Actinoplanes sandaracinus]MDI6105480.1 ricin-type beta-trefoil lectin domain protein [Actinoplanes sandaracinus]